MRAGSLRCFVFFFFYPLSLLHTLTSFCQRQPAGISSARGSCFPRQSFPAPVTFPAPAPVRTRRMRDQPRGKDRGTGEAGKRGALKSLENCGRDCGNPVICGAKAGHSSDLGAQMLSLLCLFCSCSFHSRLPSLPTAAYLTLFSQLH